MTKPTFFIVAEPIQNSHNYWPSHSWRRDESSWSIFLFLLASLQLWTLCWYTEVYIISGSIRVSLLYGCTTEIKAIERVLHSLVLTYLSIIQFSRASRPISTSSCLPEIGNQKQFFSPTPWRRAWWWIAGGHALAYCTPFSSMVPHGSVKGYSDYSHSLHVSWGAYENTCLLWSFMPIVLFMHHINACFVVVACLQQRYCGVWKSCINNSNLHSNIRGKQLQLG